MKIIAKIKLVCSLLVLMVPIFIGPKVSHAIIAGNVQPGFQAVGALQSGAGTCTATLLNESWIITHPECLTSSGVTNFIIGNDYNSPDATIAIDTFVVHPSYDTNTLSNAIALGHLSTSAGSIDPIQLMSPGNDILSPGDTILHVGYGITSYPDGTNSTRRSFTSQIDDIYTDTFLTDSSFGGPCSGDLGGPALYNVTGTYYLAGIYSFGDQECNQFAANVRISNYYDFISETIESGGAVVPVPAAFWLFGSGLIGLIGIARRKKA